MAKLDIPGYKINAHVGSGGMAVVFRAMQESLQRQVALKVLKETESKEWTERFLNEGRILYDGDIVSLLHRMAGERSVEVHLAASSRPWRKV